MTHKRKTRNKNQRRHRRSGKNLFWLVMSRRRRSKVLILYTRKPYLWHMLGEYKNDYKDGKQWMSIYAECYPPLKVGERIPVDCETPVEVKLIICNAEPDMYIQRYKDCLFINSHLETYYIGGDRHRKVTEVPHVFRISNKLFPDVTEESGIVGVKIARR